MKYQLAEIWAAWERQHQQKLSYRQLARQTGVSTSIIHRIMENKNVEVQSLEKLAQFFGVPLSAMIADED